jgi:hypothetical protein
VSGLPVEAKGGNPSLANQLKAYDGSGSARVREITQQQKQQISTTPTPVSKPSSETSNNDSREPIATWAYRYNPGVGATLSRAGAFGNLYQYTDSLAAPTSSKSRSVGVTFQFPSDWLQLDRQIGGIQYVDQRNGDKLYVFRAPLPAAPSTDNDSSNNDSVDLTTLPKKWIADAIFNPNSSFAQSGQTVQDYSVSKAQVLSGPECSPTKGLCAPHRRFTLKFTTVTGNGLQVERRGLVDAYQVDNDVYMIMTSTNAVKFEQKDSRERETAENIVDSFRIDV